MNKRQKKKSMFPVKEKKHCKELTKKYGIHRCFHCIQTVNFRGCKWRCYYDVKTKCWCVNKKYLTTSERRLLDFKDYESSFVSAEICNANVKPGITFFDEQEATNE